MVISIATGIDVPFGTAGGSIILLDDLYLSNPLPMHSTIWMLEASNGEIPPTQSNSTVISLDGTKKCIDNPGFDAYVSDLTAAIQLSADHSPDVLHCHHFAFGMSLALLNAFPQIPAIGLCHGTDLLLAETNATQFGVFRQILTRCDALVFPTMAMYERTLRLEPSLNRNKMHLIPWGIPDTILSRPLKPRKRQAGILNVLYAGRLSAEKGAETLIRACAGHPSIKLSIASPKVAFETIQSQMSDCDFSNIEHIGWLKRAHLCDQFAKHDCIVIPSTVLEAFCLVAVEAQACGLPVVFQPVIGLTEVLADSGIAIDMSSHSALRKRLEQLAHDPAQFDACIEKGLRNAARFPISNTRHSLQKLSHSLCT